MDRFPIRIGNTVNKIPFFKNEIDYKALSQSIGAVFTQFGDAHLVQFFNKHFSVYKLFCVVHDCFYCYPLFAAKLKPALQLSYLDLYKLDLVAFNFKRKEESSLKEAFYIWRNTNPKNILLTKHFNNPDFVKH